MIFLEFLKDPATTKGIAQNIDESAGTACIFKAVTLFVVQYLGLNGGQLLIGFKCVHDGLQPVFTDLHIRIQQDDDLLIQLCHPRIITARIALILCIQYLPHFGKGSVEQIDRIVRGCVVDHVHLCMGTAVLQYVG
ncbi:MAG: Uncharacterised protein [Flavobacteriia bacterium]|nr:MAG: Uncharacterised protein [Flavobacteriia bacterium]